MMNRFPILSEQLRLERLAHPGRKVRVVIDTDTFNEIDDQFAVVYALLSPSAMQVEALYAAPFYNEKSTGPEDGMEKSYRELLKIRRLMRREDIPAFRGSTRYLSDNYEPVESDAAHDLVKRAMASDPDDPLYVVAIGAITNVASALLIEPRIMERIVLVWLGGNAMHWPDTREFNLHQDLYASRLVLDCGVPLVLAPCLGVATHLTTTLSELADHIKGKNEIGNYLYETYERCTDDHFGYSRVIWDISVFAWLNKPEWCPSSLVHSPHLSSESRWSFNPHRHFIRCIQFIQRDGVFQDLFRKIADAGVQVEV